MTKTISIKFPLKDLPKIPEKNISKFFREAAYEKIERIKKPEWKPKTPHGEKLWALRKKFITSGGELLDAPGISRELKNRSGLR